MCGDRSPNTDALDTEYSREEVVCNICGIKDENFIFFAPERIVRCRRCGLMYNNPRLDRNSLARIYSKEYFVIDENDLGVDYKAYADYMGEEPVIVRSMLRRMEKVERYAGAAGKVLDVGCAAGFSLIAARQRGWAAEGIEFSEFCVNFAAARGLKVFHGMLKDYPGQAESMDAITMWDYLEHSPDPFGDLTVCHRLLKRGGVLVLSIPNTDSWSFPLFKEKWIGFKNIEHFYYFDRSTMASLARKAGLRMEDSFYHGKYVSLSFFLSRVQYYIKFKLVLTAVKKLASLEKTKNIAFYFNPFDILNIVLRK
jgi:SAM-dependent methyltransferase